MQYTGQAKEYIDKLLGIIELERLKMGMGKYEFAEHVGIHYHTFNSFLKQDKMTHPKIVAKLLKFVENRDPLLIQKILPE